MTNFKENLKNVKAFVFDIDGVLSLQTINLNVFGIPKRTVNLRDGYAFNWPLRKAIPLGSYRVVIQDYLKRLKTLGINDIFLNSKIKLEHYKLFKEKFRLEDSEIMFMGDDIPDLEVMRLLVCRFARQMQTVKLNSCILYIDKKGGEGCVKGCC